MMVYVYLLKDFITKVYYFLVKSLVNEGNVSNDRLTNKIFFFNTGDKIETYI